ncbi:MAG: hypothetical protein RLZZ432_746 [Chloroflexota bacterium]|jgi:hypothetical protein
MTVAALITSDASPTDPSTLGRLVDAAWSGGAQPILIAGPAADGALPPSARATEAVDAAGALADAAGEVRATTGLLLLPLSHAGVDPETITTLIATHGREPRRQLIAAHDAVAGPVRLLPAGDAGEPALLVECGDGGAITPSDGRARLPYLAPPADHDAVDPWEQRGGGSGA